MELPTDFRTFLQEIRPTANQREDLQTGHKTLRRRLAKYEDLKDVIYTDFLQGSYRRATAVRPKGDARSDVDIIVVTKLDETEFTPREAMALFEPFLEKHYEGKWRKQGRSFGILMNYVELDLVLTSAPSESEEGILNSDAVRCDDSLEEARDWRLHPSWVSLEDRATRHDARVKLAEAKEEPEWKTEPLRIPDREANIWEDTHPLEQIRWTRDKNAVTDGHFVNVVKAVKWWRLENYDEPIHPKGFPLERLIGEVCPDDLNSVADGVTRTLEEIVTQYAVTVQNGGKPELPDYGVPDHDVFARISADDFADFYDQVKEGAQLARRALDSTDRTESGNLWREMFGGKFPKPPDGGGSKKDGFSSPDEPASPGRGRFA